MANSRPNIWQLQSRRDVQGLIAALRYPDPEIRKRAAVALRTLDATQAVPALKAAFRAETDRQVRANLSATLHVLDHRTDVGSLIQHQDLNGLIKALGSRNPDNVIRAAQALGQMNNRLAVEPLVMLFHNSSSPPKVRLAAADALLQLQSAPAVVTLLGALRRESWQVRRNAAAVLGQIQATWAVEPLAAALRDPHPVVRRTAAAALRRIGTADAIAAMRVRYTEPPQDDARAAPKPPPRPAAVVAPPPSAPSPPAPHPARAQPVAADSAARKTTEPKKPTTVPELPPAPEPAAHEVAPADDRPSRITRPVRKLIEFLKPRNSEQA
ncbi:MAG: HEAT repeat domain-containing protein [Chloroflexi bacterium]|nr:HEAT repeat domain-containing protein [Chloroflexota bacterium]